MFLSGVALCLCCWLYAVGYVTGSVGLHWEWVNELLMLLTVLNSTYREVFMCLNTDFFFLFWNFAGILWFLKLVYIITKNTKYLTVFLEDENSLPCKIPVLQHLLPHSDAKLTFALWWSILSERLHLMSWIQLEKNNPFVFSGISYKPVIKTFSRSLEVCSHISVYNLSLIDIVDDERHFHLLLFVLITSW